VREQTPPKPTNSVGFVMSHHNPNFSLNFTENQTKMAKTISDEQMKLDIIINGDPAQKQLLDLEKSTREVTKETKELKVQRRLLTEQGKKDTAEWKALDAAIKTNTNTIDNNTAKMKILQDQIGITGLTMHQLSQKAMTLKMSLQNAVPGGEAYQRYQTELNQVNTRLDELRGRSRTAQSSIGTLADGFNRYQGMALAAVASLTGVVLSIQKIIDINGKLSDAQSDVMKTTGMTKVEVDELTKSFGLLQTRTSRIDLLGIAEQGGRIGIAKAEIGDFVAVMNKASVSLGDSFTGGAEEVANKLGKIKFLFEETKNMNVDQSYNAIGSAINELGANGVASEANIAEFTTRIGSLTDVLKPTIQETLALGTAFEESGIEAEVSSRAYGIFMKQASTETGKFAKVMGISEQKVKDMINTNPLEFMLQFAQGMKGMSATDTAKTLDALGISADGANKVIGAMGNNTARFRELIDLSNNSFASGTSLINEYNIKNNNLAATLEKISKTVSGWFSSETFIKWLGGAVEWFAKFIGATEDADGGITRFKNGLIAFVKITTVVMTAMLSYKGALQLIAIYENGVTSATTLMNVAQKANALTGGLLKTIYLGLQYAYYTLTLQTERATVAQVAFNTATKSNPIALVISLLVALGTAYLILHKSIDTSIQKQQNLNDVRNAANKAVIEEKTNLENLLKIARDETQSKKNREEAIKRINEISPEYLSNLTLEKINTLEAKDAIDSYLVSLDKKAMKEAFAAKRAEISTKVLDATNDKEKSKYGGFFQGADTDFKKIYETEKEDVEKSKKLMNGWNSSKMTAYREYKQAIIEAEDELKSLSDEEQKFIKKNSNLYTAPTVTPGSGFNPAGGTGTGDGKGTKKDPNSTQAEINRRKIEEAQKTKDELLALDQQLQDDKLSIMQDGAAKELILEQERYLREIATLEKKKVHTDDLAKLNEDLSKAEESGDKAEYARLFALKEGWTAKNKAYDDKIDAIKLGKLDIHNKKIATLTEKAAKERLDKEQKEFDLGKIQRETAYNELLAKAGDNEEEKARLKKEYDDNELIENKKFYNKLLDELNLIISKGTFDKMDMSLLSPEDVEAIKKRAAEVGLILSELGIKKGELSGKKEPTKAEKLGISKSETDIFGFTPDNWKEFYDNVKKGEIGVNEMVFAVSALVNMWGKYNQMVTANENKQLQAFEQSSDKKKTKLKKQLDSGVISQKNYDRQVAKIDKELDEKKADLAYKQAKRERMIAIASAISGTAMAVVGALGNKPWTPFNFALAGMVGAMGLLQLGTILSQPLPAKGHEQGLYGDYVTREQDGKTFKSQYGGKTRSGLVSKTSHFLVAENGPEMVIDNKAWRQMNPAVKDSLIRELRGIKGFEQGLYNQEKMRVEVPATSAPAPSGNDAMMNQMMMSLIAENLSVLKDLRDKGVVGIMTNKDLKSMGYLKDGIDSYNELRTKSKK